MPLYHVTLTSGNQRAVIAVDHVLEEYGISEQEFVSTWFLDRPEIQGDGDTVEEAVNNLIKDLAKYEERSIRYAEEPHIMQMRHQFAKSIKWSKARFITPIITNEDVDAIDLD